MQPRAIETRYSGCRFRSRLEARWAVYLNAIKAKWVYEPEGFVLSDGTHYLPDFFVYRYDSDENERARDWGYWLEVKPVAPTAAESEKFAMLCRESGHHGVIAHGRFPNIVVENHNYNLRGGVITRDLLIGGRIPDVVSRLPHLTQDAHAMARLSAAEARFEHGERPAI